MSSEWAIFTPEQYLIILTAALSALISSVAMGLISSRGIEENFLPWVTKVILCAIFALVVTSLITTIALYSMTKVAVRNPKAVVGCWVQIVDSSERPMSLGRLYRRLDGQLVFDGLAYSPAFEVTARWNARVYSVERGGSRYHYQGKGYIHDQETTDTVDMIGRFDIVPSFGGPLEGTGRFVDEKSDILSKTTYRTYKVRCPEAGTEVQFLRENWTPPKTLADKADL